MNFKNTKYIHQLFEYQAAKNPNSIAVVFGHQNITYGKLNQRANQLANYLISQGVKADMLVGICIERSIDLIVGLLAVLKAGGAYLPIDLSYPQERLEFMMDDANASIMLTQKSLTDRIPHSKAKNVYLDDFDYSSQNSVNPVIRLESENLAYVIYTSGSTGKPNGVMVTHYNVARLFENTNQWYNFSENDVWTFFHSFAFDFSVWEIWGALLYGGRIVIVPYLLSRSPEAFYDLLIKEKVTVLNQTPSAFYQLIQAENILNRNRELALRYVIFGGEALNLAALKPWFEKHDDKKPQLVNMYGITETTVHVTYRPLTSKDISSGSVIGQPLPDLQLYVLNEQLKPVKVGETGELYVGGAGLSKGYLNRPELNKARFIKNPFSVNGESKLYKTGDLGRVLDNNDIEYLGRIDHQVKIRGFRIELGEIENSIRNYSGVKDCAVKVHKYSEDVVRIIAYVVSDLNISFDDLKKHLTQFLPEYMIPNSFITLDKIPLTPNGKADLKALPIPEQSSSIQPVVIGENKSDVIEDKIKSIWKDLLGIDNIGLNDNFFDAGGNSLLMGRMQLKINHTFQENISIVDVFQYPTIASLARLIGKKSESSKTSAQKNSAIRNLTGTDIAIIGMAGRYPKAKSVKEFWQNLVDGVEAISFFTDEELEYVPKGNLDSEIKFVRARGILENADQFDAEFFGFNPREAAIMDPQHRLFLECAWEALEDAGYCSEKYKGSIGVFAGSSLNTYLMYNVLKDRESTEEMANSYQIADYTTLTGNDNAFLTTKVAYKLGLRGPAVNVQTACSTSLVAIGLAYQSLISGQSNMALAGGVSITFPQKRGYFFVDGSIGSVDGHCKPFDADATGTVFSHGSGIVVMKRLEDAINDGDSIYAVIKSIALNNDGLDKAGYMTPSVEGQSEVILKAQQLAGVDPSTIKYVETHGTGTPVGDPIEVASLEKAFRESTNEKQFCGIGSVKSNLGHTDAAAGVTGFIKTALSLYHRLIPPTLHYTKPNPRIDFANSPFYVIDKLTPLEGMQRPLRAAVSAFGVGGTNAHAILEEFPYISFSCEEDRDKYLLVVSAKTENSLKNNMSALADYLKNNPNEAINDIAYTLQEGRKEFECRQFFIADDVPSASKEIETVIKSSSNKNKININDKPHIVFMFPGQGAQYVNMGKGLYKDEKLFRVLVDQCAEFLKPHLELDIRDLLFPKDNGEGAAKRLEQTVYTQPALFIIEYALARLLMSYGIKPASMIGHSVGDYVAACLAGVFSLEDTLYIIAMRARLMQKQAPGSMLSVRLNETQVKEHLTKDVYLAAINSPNLVVLSGPTEKIKDLSEKLSGLSIENRVLFTSHAYHSKMMEPALKPFADEFGKIKLNKPSSPFISSLTGTWITDEQATDPEFWASQLRNSVRFSDGIIELQKKKNLVLIELGPGRALSTMVSQHRNENVKQTTITTLIQPNENTDDKTNLLNAVGKLWLAGVKIDWLNFYKGKKRRRLHLPTYQFDRKSYWIEPPRREADKPKIPSEVQIPQSLKRVVKKPKVKKVTQQSTQSRKEYIIDILKEVLEELSGMKKSDLEESKSFLELGFDSLFMTQVSLAFQKKFEVKITLRQLLDTAPTISAIAEFIDSKLPEGKFEPLAQEVIVEDEGEVEEFEEALQTDEAGMSVQYKSGNTSFENLIAEQLEIMKRQLELLGGKGISALPNLQLEIAKAKEAVANVLAPSKEKESKKTETPEKKVFERFGPYKPIETKKGGALTDKQQKYLSKLIDNYTRKTPNSKKLTQEHRSHYSDPRTVSGFLPIWKEMTYQIITKKSRGSKLIDVDDNEYIDVIMGFGQYLFGHNPKFVRDAVEEQLKLGFEIGPQSPIAGEVAKLICEFTNFERAAFCVTGSEAVLGAIRAARTVTGKDKIIFFSGDYHGIIDEVLIKTIVNGDQVRTMPIAPGIPRENVQNTIALEYGSEESLKVIERMLPEIGGIMVEPIQARRPDLQPKEFLQKLRKITEDAGIPLIFDEVITGFRTCQGGAQEWFGIKADIGTYGKVLGGGFPIGIIAGKKLYMDAFDGGYWQYGDDSIPEAGVTFFAGTFARHPLSLTACYAVLKYLRSKDGILQKDLNTKAGELADELNQFMAQRNVPIKILNFSSVIYYSYPKDLNYFSLLFYVLRHKGIHILEGFPMFLSEAHTEKDIRHIIDAFKESIIELQDNGFFPAPLGDVDKQPVKEKTEKELSINRFPLSEAQKEIWVASMISEKASCSFNEST
jgi:amino acid adenylation domain-containing protein